jgi:hypothetical protein
MKAEKERQLLTVGKGVGEETMATRKPGPL